MSELLVPPQNIVGGITEYGQRLQAFMHSTRFPKALLATPDYVMIKSGTPLDFNQKVKEIERWTKYRAFLQIDWRFLVAAQLIVPLVLIPDKKIPMVEIMEAKSPEGTADYIGAEYVAFFFSNLSTAKRLLINNDKISFRERSDGLHRWLDIPINGQGQELRIVDKRIAGIVEQAIESGDAFLLSAQRN